MDAVQIIEEIPALSGAEEEAQASGSQSRSEASGFLEALQQAGMAEETLAEEDALLAVAKLPPDYGSVAEQGNETDEKAVPLPQPRIPEAPTSIPETPLKESAHPADSGVPELSSPTEARPALELLVGRTEPERPEDSRVRAHGLEIPHGEAGRTLRENELSPPDNPARPTLPLAAAARAHEVVPQKGTAEPAPSGTTEPARGELAPPERLDGQAGFESDPRGNSEGSNDPSRGLIREPAPETVPAKLESATANIQIRELTSSAPGRVLPELPVQNESRILAQVRMLLQEGGGTARIQLEPPQLGHLRLTLTVTKTSVQLTVIAEKAAVAELFTRHLPELRLALETQGLQIDRADVDVRDESEDHGFPTRGSPFEQDRAPHGDSPPPEHGADSAAMELSQAWPLRVEDLGSLSIHV